MQRDMDLVTGAMYRGRAMVSISEIALATETTKQAVCNWVARHPSFPEPAFQLRSGPVWEWRKVARWLMKQQKCFTDIETGSIYRPSRAS